MIACMRVTLIHFMRKIFDIYRPIDIEFHEYHDVIFEITTTYNIFVSFLIPIYTYQRVRLLSHKMRDLYSLMIYAFKMHDKAMI